MKAFLLVFCVCMLTSPILFGQTTDVVLDVDYIHQVQDMDESEFNGHNACGPTTAVSIVRYFHLQPNLPSGEPEGYYVYHPYPSGFEDQSGNRYESDYAMDMNASTQHVHSVNGAHGYIVENSGNEQNPYWGANVGYLHDYLENHGLIVGNIISQDIFEEVRKYIDNGIPLIGHLTGHYLVVIGYRDESGTSNDQVIVNDPYGDKDATWNGTTSGEDKDYSISRLIDITPVFPVGIFETEGVDGWRSDGSSQAFIDKYGDHSNKIGYPNNNHSDAPEQGTSLVHEWYGTWIQDFRQPDLTQSHFGTDGETAIILSPDPTEAYLVKEGFWEWYKTKELYTSGWKPRGPYKLGRPTTDEFEFGVLTQQNFENGYLVYYDSDPDDEVSGKVDSYDLTGFKIAAVVENSIDIHSIPQGAQIWEGTTLLTTTPLALSLSENETRTLTAKMPGYYDKEFTVDWQDGQEVVMVELEPISTGTGGTDAKHYSLATEPGYLDFGLTANELVFSTNDGVSNATVNWTITPSKPWISASMTQGSNSQDITVTVNRDGLSGYYEESVTIASNAGTIYLPVFVDAFSSWSGTQVFTFDDQSALDAWLVVEGTPDSSKVRGSALRLFNGGLYRNRSLSEAVLTAPGAIFDSVAVTFDLDNGSYSTGNQVTTVYVNWQDANHSYRWLISNSASDQRVKFQKVYPDGQGVQQTATLWEQSGIALGEGTYRVTAVDGVFTFRDEPSGSTINASVTDVTYSYGRIGFGVSEEEALIDNVTVTGHTPVVYRNAAFAQDEHTLGVWNMAGALGSAEKRANAVSGQLLSETGVTSEAGVNYALDRSYGLARGSSCLPTDLDTEIDGAAQLTIEGWFQFNNSDNNVILGRWDTGQSYLQLEWNSGYGPLYAFVASSASDPGSRYGYSASIERENERWYYIVLVYDGTASSNTERLKLYIDGQEVPLSYAGTIPASLPSLGNTLPLVLGYRKLTPAGSTLGGRIGAVRVSSCARSAAEIAAVMDNEIILSVTSAAVDLSPAAPLDTLIVSSGTEASISAQAAWLSVTPASITGVNQPVVISADSAGLSDGVYLDTLVIASADSSISLPVIFTISTPGSGPFDLDASTIGLWNMSGVLGTDGKRMNEASSLLLSEVSVSSTDGPDSQTNGAYGFSKTSWSRLLSDLDTEVDGISQLTVELWIAFDNANNNVVFGRWESGKSSLILEWQSDPGKLYAYIASSTSDGGSNYAYSANIDRGSDWRYLALVFDGTASGNSSRLKIYLDGNPVSLSYNGTIPSALTSCGSGYPLIFGYYKDANAGSSSLGGAIAAVRVSNTARSSAEIADQYSQSLSKRAGPGSEADIGVVPEKYELHAAYPNPFNPTTTIPFDLPHEMHVTITVYDMLGREVATLISERRDAGAYTIEWNGKNTQGHSAASGVYLYRMKAGSYVMTRKLTLLK